MSASDAVPLPRLGEVFFDVRGDSRTMRLSWYADTGVAVFSIWQGGTCTGTFRLPIGDLPRMVEALQGGPSGRGQRQRGGQPGPGASRLPGPPGPGPVPAPEDEVATGMWRPADEDFQPAAGGYRDEAGSGGYRDEAGSGAYGIGALDPARPGRSAAPGGELPGFGEDLGSDGYPPLGSGGHLTGAGSGGYPEGSGSGPFPGVAGSGGFPGDPGSGGFPGHPGSGGFPGYPGSGGFPAGGGSGAYPSDADSGPYPGAGSEAFPAGAGTGGYPAAGAGGGYREDRFGSGGYPEDRAASSGGFPAGGRPARAGREHGAGTGDATRAHDLTADGTGPMASQDSPGSDGYPAAGRRQDPRAGQGSGRHGRGAPGGGAPPAGRAGYRGDPGSGGLPGTGRLPGTAGTGGYQEDEAGYPGDPAARRGTGGPADRPGVPRQRGGRSGYVPRKQQFPGGLGRPAGPGRPSGPGEAVGRVPYQDLPDRPETGDHAGEAGYREPARSGYPGASPARPYVGRPGAGGDELGPDDWETGLPPRRDSFIDEPSPDSFPYGGEPGNDRERGRYPGRH